MIIIVELSIMPQWHLIWSGFPSFIDANNLFSNGDPARSTLVTCRCKREDLLFVDDQVVSMYLWSINTMYLWSIYNEWRKVVGFLVTSK